MYKILVDGEVLCDSRVDDLAVISPKVTLEVNAAGSFSFTVPPEHPKYDLIQKRTSIIDVYRDSELIFEGIAISDDVDFYGQKSIECEGELTFLNDTMQRPAKYSAVTVRQLLTAYIANHNAQADANKQFTVGTVTVEDPNDEITCYTNYDSTLDQIKGDLVDDLGGYLRVRHADGVRYLDYLAESPNTNTQTIELGKNLIDFTTNIDTSEIATVIIPLGATLDTQSIEGLDERLTIKSVNDDKDYLESTTAIASLGRCEQVVTWDDVETAAALKTKGEKYLTDSQFADMTIEAKAVDFHMAKSTIESFKLLDKIRVISAAHGIDRYFTLSKMTIDLANPSQNTVTLGDTFQAGMTVQQKKASDELLKKVDAIQPSAILEQAKANATSIIKMGANGYVRFVYNDDMSVKEIQIVDNLDSPTKIWRWNVNGFGYTNDGGETYGLALTMDGHFVADAITVDGLEVGNNVTMGENATIKWNQVTDQPTIPAKTSDLTNDSDFINGTQVTTITEDTIKTTSVVAQNLVTKILECGTDTATVSIKDGKIDFGQESGLYLNGTKVFSFSTSDRKGGTAMSIPASLSITDNLVMCDAIDMYDPTGTSEKWKMYQANNLIFSVNGTTDKVAFSTEGVIVCAGVYVPDQSSRLIKENIAPMTDEDGLKLLDLNPIHFDYIPEWLDKKNQCGLIAEDVEDILPEIITNPNADESKFDKSKGYMANAEYVKGIDYGKLTPHLIKLCQVQQKQIDDLEARLSALESIVANLKGDE